MGQDIEALGDVGHWVAGSIAANECLFEDGTSRTVEDLIVSEVRRFLSEDEDGVKISAMDPLEFARACGRSCDATNPGNDFVWWGRHGR